MQTDAGKIEVKGGLGNLSPVEFSELLRELHTCSEASEWAQGKDLAEVWHTCHRGDWMLWLLGRTVDRPGWLSRKEICAIVCDVVEPAMRHVRTGELRPQACLDTVRGWIAGTHTIEQVREARRAAAYAVTAAVGAADAAAVASIASAYAVTAAYAASVSAVAETSNDDFANATSLAAVAYAAAAAAYVTLGPVDYYYRELHARGLRESADICRKHVRIECDKSEVAK